MLKKGLFLAAAGTLLLGLCFGRNAMSYVKTAANKISETVKNNVSIGYEIDRARQMIKDLIPEIRHNMQLIAKEEIQVKQFEKRVDQADKTLSRDREEILRMKEALDQNPEAKTLKFANLTYPVHRVNKDLANRFKHYKKADETSFNLSKVLDARQRTLVAARQKLNGMLAAKQQLEVDVENLEARLKMVEVAQTTSEFDFDDSHLARTKELINDINTRIEVSARLLDVETDFPARIPLESLEEMEDISDQITEYFTTDGIEEGGDASITTEPSASQLSLR
jgi:chromosome segregation ATPase